MRQVGNASYFFPRNCDYSYKEIYLCHGYIFKKLRLFLQKVSYFIINTFFSLLPQIMYVGA